VHSRWGKGIRTQGYIGIGEVGWAMQLRVCGSEERVRWLFMMVAGCHRGIWENSRKLLVGHREGKPAPVDEGDGRKGVGASGDTRPRPQGRSHGACT
jgi:hypothetical protein